MKESPRLTAEYSEFDTEVRRRQSIIGCIVSLILVPLGGVLDLVVYPDFFLDLLYIRIICSAVLIVICGLHFYCKNRLSFRILCISWPLVISLAISFMIASVDGISGSYYAGLNLVVLGAALLLPLTLADTLIIVLLTGFFYGLTYKVSNVLSPSIDFRLLFNNFFFLFTTGVICCTSSYFSTRMREREFALRYELNEQNIKLGELDRIKSNFYANISHELRTPLTLILAPVEDAIVDPSTGSKVREQLGYVRYNAYRLLKLVNDLLDILKLEEKKQLLDKQAIDLEKMLRNIVAGIQSLADKKSISLNQNYSAARSVVIGDVSALEKVFVNLLNNAVKFTDSGGNVSVAMHSSDTDLTVIVSDTGAGISEDQVPYVFDRFHQVDGSATRKHQGTGLGLALVKELTELHDGTVEIQSELGEGTSLTIQLPLSDSRIIPNTSSDTDNPKDEIDHLHRTANYLVSDDRPLNSGATRRKTTPDLYTGASLLIVDDEPDVRHYLQDALNGIYDVDVALDGKRGLKKIRENKPDLVLLDLMLPEIDGLEVCKLVKQDPNCANIKLMLLTARTDEKSKIKALENGADDFLTKPFSTVEIKTRLRNLLKNNEMQKEIASKNEELSQAFLRLKDAQGQLVQSEKLNAIGRLAAGLMHEVNNPLNFAFGTFQMLERESIVHEHEHIAEMMSDIREGMVRIANIVKDLKTFAYPDKADVESNFILYSVVESATRFTSAKASDTAIALDFAKDIEVKGSASHIIQIFVNLIENAMDAMIEAKVKDKKINIFVSDDIENHERLRVHVRDNGSGISQENIESIFDPFFTTKTVGEGMGMGLSIATTIIKNHGGQLSVESKLGEYTEFQFDLLKGNHTAMNPNLDQGDRPCAS